MGHIQQIIFLIVLIVAGLLIARRIRGIVRGIKLGRGTLIGDRVPLRIRNVLLIAFGQKKMFKRWTPAILHFFVYAGFILINIEVLEIIIDGLSGTHRIFSKPLGSFYPAMINVFEFLAVAVLISCLIFLVRRNIVKIKRFWSAEMKAWPRLDANIILLSEIILMMAILLMNAADQQLQALGAAHYPAAGTFVFSSFLLPVLGGLDEGALIIVERVAWWLHIVGIFSFAVYVTYSKHLHIFMAFPNTYYARLESRGQLENMPVVTQEVRSMLGLENISSNMPAPERFGARDVGDLTRKSLMDAFTCTECGRCTSECPANLTGKKLSPRKIMMDVRDRAEEVIRNNNNGAQKQLLGDYITKEEINACTSCNACVEACPVLINPLDIIIEMRRYVSMEESGAPSSWNAMFQNIETNFAPWKFSPSDRFNWAKDLKN